MIVKTRTATQRLAGTLATVAATLLLAATGMTTPGQHAAPGSEPPGKDCPVGNCSPLPH